MTGCHVMLPLQGQTVGEAAFTPGHDNESWPPISQPAFGVCPVCGGGFGGLAEDSIAVLHSVGQYIAQRVGIGDCSADTSVCIKQLFHCCGIAVWRGMPLCGFPSPFYRWACVNFIMCCSHVH